MSVYGVLTLSSLSEVRLLTSSTMSGSGSGSGSASSSVRCSMVSVMLLEGNCEVNGSELGRVTELPGKASVPIFTYYGCKILIFGNKHAEEVARIVKEGGVEEEHSGVDSVESVPGVDECYVVDGDDGDVTAVNVVNTHAQLEVMRDDCRKYFNDDQQRQQLNGGSAPQPQPQPPRVLIVGNNSTGKLSLLKTLTSYALKVGRSPLVVNLNPGLSITSVTPVPGCVGCKVVAGSFDYPTVLSSFTTSDANLKGDQGGGQRHPLCLFYGNKKIRSNPSFYYEVVSKLGTSVSLRASSCLSKVESSNCQRALNEYTSGFIAIGSAECDIEGLEKIVEDLSVNVVIVLDKVSLRLCVCVCVFVIFYYHYLARVWVCVGVFRSCWKRR